jgi:choloylglycine hydrolase
VKENSVAEEDEESSVNQFFHILDAVTMPKGCVWTKDGYEYTRYSSCCNADKGIYYYKTYDRFEILSVNLHDADLDGKELSFE